MASVPTIPETITVHLGAPDSDAENVTVPFLEYVANVASSEIYPTWPENAIRANMYAEISFALNRVYTEYYRTRGHDFDITSVTAYDQFYVKNRNVFENIRELAGELFNDYIRREGSVEPLFAQYCNGTTVTCQGLSQWGSVELAERGYTPLEILQYYYGDNIELVKNAPVAGNKASLPPFPLRLGSVGDDVRTVQIRLNRISSNYPSIPKIILTDGVFGTDTEAAVKEFQKTFGMDADGVVGKSTWYTIQNIYIGVKRLNSLYAEGIKQSEVTQQFPSVLREGSTGVGVRNLQYYINYLSQYYSTIPAVQIDGFFGPKTLGAVKALQREFDLDVDGIVGPITWNALYRAYVGIVSTVPIEYVLGAAVPYGGVPLRLGADSDSVRLLQEYLNVIAKSYPDIPSVSTTGYFGPRTQEAVIAFQRQAGLPATGVVEAITWNEIASLFEDITKGGNLQNGQYPGYTVEREEE